MQAKMAVPEHNVWKERSLKCVARDTGTPIGAALPHRALHHSIYRIMSAIISVATYTAGPTPATRHHLAIPPPPVKQRYFKLPGSLWKNARVSNVN